MDDVAERSEKRASIWVRHFMASNQGTFSRRERSPGAGRSSATFPAEEKSHFSAGHG